MIRRRTMQILIHQAFMTRKGWVSYLWELPWTASDKPPKKLKPKRKRGRRKPRRRNQK